jgi:hypothetical protein
MFDRKKSLKSDEKLIDLALTDPALTLNLKNVSQTRLYKDKKRAKIRSKFIE